MKRIKDEFLDSIEKVLPLKGLSILEIGCGDGGRSVAIASRCRSLTAIEPDEDKLKLAMAQKVPNATFEKGSGEKLSFSDQSFDVVIFTLSLHHIPVVKMSTAGLAEELIFFK